MNTESENVSIAFENVEVAYPAGRFHVSANFTISPGERFAILGPSGGGKSTIIKVAAGLIRGNGSRKKWFGLKSPAFHSGKVLISGTDVSDTEPSARAISLISQHSNLYPHLSVRQNLELVTSRDTSAETVNSLLEELGIASLLERRPAQISGGEGQRVALAKAILRRSACVAFDEPMSGLDQHLKIGLTALIRQVLHKHPKTLLMVSHDQETTLGLADRIAFLHLGHILQISPPRQMIENPAHPVVATSIDPFFRVRLDGISHTANGFRVGTDEFCGQQVPTGTSNVVINTRKLYVSHNGSPGVGWELALPDYRTTFVGGQAVLAFSLTCSDRDWNVPCTTNGNGAYPTKIVIPPDGLFAFDEHGNRLKF